MAPELSAVEEQGGTSLSYYGTVIMGLLMDSRFETIRLEVIDKIEKMSQEELQVLDQRGYPRQRLKDAVRYLKLPRA
jgi:hypothetical protein